MSSVVTAVSSSNYKHLHFKPIQDGLSWPILHEKYTRLKKKHKFEDDFETWLLRYHGLNCFNTSSNVENFNDKVLDATMGINVSFNQTGFSNIFEASIKVARVELARDRPRKQQEELQQRCFREMKMAFESGAPTHFSIKKNEMQKFQKEIQSSNNVLKYGVCPICLNDINPNEACILLRRRNMGKANCSLQEKFIEQACKCTFCITCITKHNANELRSIRNIRYAPVNRNTDKLPDCPCCKNKYFGVLRFQSSVQPRSKCETIIVPHSIQAFLFPTSNHHNCFDHLHKGGVLASLFPSFNTSSYGLHQFLFEQERALTMRKNIVGKPNFSGMDVKEAFNATDQQRKLAREGNTNSSDVVRSLDDLRFSSNLYLDGRRELKAFIDHAQEEFDVIFAQFKGVEQDWLHCNPFPYSEYAKELHTVVSKLKAVYDAIRDEELNFAQSQMEPTLEAFDGEIWDGRTRGVDAFMEAADAVAAIAERNLRRSRSNSLQLLEDDRPATRRRIITDVRMV